MLDVKDLTSFLERNTPELYVVKPFVPHRCGLERGLVFIKRVFTGTLAA